MKSVQLALQAVVLDKRIERFSAAARRLLVACYQAKHAKREWYVISVALVRIFDLRSERRRKIYVQTNALDQ